MSSFSKATLFAKSPVLLAPLAGVSDHPFRRVCVGLGADLTYVEMLSAVALSHRSSRTLQMMARHADEDLLGVQVTGATPEIVGEAVAYLDQSSMETVDLNMGCPVTKVTGGGCGSALLRDPSNVFAVVKAARAATSKPLSVKIRLGWDKNTYTGLDCAKAIADAGADWLTVHGRLRNDNYAVPVDLMRIKAIKDAVAIPVVGNGNIFALADAEKMLRVTGVDGVMVSRGALGNPWLFRELKGGTARVTLTEWHEVVHQHLRWQQETYGDRGAGPICMRKHLLWYLKGWPGVRRVREVVSHCEAIGDALKAIDDFALELANQGAVYRDAVGGNSQEHYLEDPKFAMDRQLDRGVGHEGLDVGLSPG
jgi:tRNA-dihydrouridine synthase B